MFTNDLSSSKIGQVSHFPILSLNTVTNALTRAIQSVNKRKNIQSCQLEFFQCSQHKQILILNFLVFLLFCPCPVVRLSPLGTVATTGLLYQPQMIDDGDCGSTGGMMMFRENRSTVRKPAPSATLSTTNPTRPDPRSNLGCHGGKPATNFLSYGASVF
jgi:hypothetical protein